MEKLNNYTIRSYDFTRWFFGIVLLIVITFGTLLFVLQINETVKILEGEIVSTNPQSDYKAPFEGQLIKINVKEGQHISKGDTLIVIQNTENSTQHVSRKNEIDFVGKSLQSIFVQQQDLQRKRSALGEENRLNTGKLDIEISRLNNAIINLDEQIAFQKEKYNSANEKFQADSMLFRKDMLSKAEYNSSRDEKLAVKASLANLENEKRKNLNDKKLLSNSYSRDKNLFEVKHVELDEQEQALIQSRNQLENQLVQAEQSFRKIETDINRENVIATNDGIVNYIFNTTKTSNLLSKGDLLISIAPANLEYYAKAIIAQKDIPYVKEGLAARLKLDAYYHFEHGIMKGKVSYLAERKENEKFYALIQLPLSKDFQLKSGYTIQGEIVVKKMPLYQYFIKKLFKRFDRP